MIKGALALALMSSMGVGGVVSISPEADVTASYFMPSIVVYNRTYSPQPYRYVHKPVISHRVMHKTHKPVIKKEHKPSEPHRIKKAEKPKSFVQKVKENRGKK